MEQIDTDNSITLNLLGLQNDNKTVEDITSNIGTQQMMQPLKLQEFN